VLGQHPTTLHFGLGASTHVDSIEVRWPNGATRTIQNPDIDRTRLVEASSAPRKPAR